jgi:putative chitinase
MGGVLDMNRAAFFAHLRKRDSGVFGTSLSQAQVQGTDALLDAIERHGIPDIRHAANILAQVYHETGGRMMPVRETFANSDAQAIARLDAAFARGQLPWVRNPYWRDGWFGRGAIQITHRENYKRLGDRIGVNLAANRDRALDPVVSADIAVIGMAEGLFTGKSLSDYFNASGSDVRNARRIVNGPDGTEDRVAGYHRAFLAALKAGDWRPGKASGTSRTPGQPGSNRTGLIAIVLIILAAIAAFITGG